MLQVGHGQRWYGEFVFALQVQHRPAGHQDLQPGTGREEFGEQGRGLQHLLEVIQEQQQLFVPQEGFELVDG